MQLKKRSQERAGRNNRKDKTETTSSSGSDNPTASIQKDETTNALHCVIASLKKDRRLDSKWKNTRESRMMSIQRVFQVAVWQWCQKFHSRVSQSIFEQQEGGSVIDFSAILESPKETLKQKQRGKGVMKQRKKARKMRQNELRTKMKWRKNGKARKTEKNEKSEKEIAKSGQIDNRERKSERE